MTQEEIRIIVKDNIDKSIKNLGLLDNKVKTTTSSVGKFKSVFAGIGGIIKKFRVVGVTLGALGYGLSKLIKPTSDFIEANNKFNAVYKDIKKTAQDTMNRLRQEYKLSKSAATEYLGTTGDILTGFGLSQKAALGLSDNVVRLATDLSSFSNVPVKQAVDALTKSFTGEREALKSLGIVINEEMVKARESVVAQQLLADGFIGTEEQLKRTARAHATMQLATEQSKNAAGDFNRSLSSSLPNLIKVIKAKISDLHIGIVQKILPAVMNVAKAIDRILSTDEEKSFSKSNTSIDRLMKARARKDSKAIAIYEESLRNQIKRNQNKISKTFITGLDFNKIYSADEMKDEINKATILLEKSQNKMDQYEETKKGDWTFDIFNTNYNKIKSTIQRYKEFIEKANTTIASIELLGKINKNAKQALDSKTSLNEEETSSENIVPTVIDNNKKNESDEKADKLLDWFYERENRKEDLRIEDLRKESAYVDELVSVNEKGTRKLTENEKKIVENAKKIKEGIEAEINSIKFDSFKKSFETVTGIVGNAMSTIGDIMKAHFDAELDAINRNYAVKKAHLEMETEQEEMLREFRAEQEAIEFERKYGLSQEAYLQMEEGAQKEFEKRQSLSRQEELINLKAVKSREARDKQLAKLDEEKAKKEKEIKSKGFIADKAMRISNIIMDTARAVVGFLANPSGIAGMILSAAAGVTGIAQLGIVSSQKNPYAYKKGGIAMTEQFARLGEEGPEMVLPAPMTKMLNDLSKIYDKKGVSSEMQEVAQEVTSYDNRNYNIEINKPENLDDFNRQLQEEIGESILDVVN